MDTKNDDKKFWYMIFSLGIAGQTKMFNCYLNKLRINQNNFIISVNSR